MVKSSVYLTYPLSHGFESLETAEQRVQSQETAMLRVQSPGAARPRVQTPGKS